MLGLFDSNENKYAVVLNCGPDELAQSLNGFEYARELNESGYHVEVYLDGEATKWPGHVKSNPDVPVADVYDDVAEAGLIEGACGVCAAIFETAEECRIAGVDVSEEGHAPTMSALADEDFEIVTVG